MAGGKPDTSRGEDAAEIVGEPSCSGADASTYSESIPPSIAAESPSFFTSFFTRVWIQILTACSGVLWGARGDGLSGPRTSGLASAAQEDNESEVSSRIAASKSTWSEVPGRDIHHSVCVSVPSPREFSVWEKLKASAPHFFQDFDELLDLGRQIGEGGQAQIFEAKWKGKEEFDLVLKVFKLDAGFLLSDLERHWPRTMRKGAEDSNEPRLRNRRRGAFVFEEAMLNAIGARCIIMGATLMEHGRFAFLMERYWGDLRTLIDQKVKENTHRWKIDLFKNRTPFSFQDSILIILQIASGMYELHREGVMHRDLKAANVFIHMRKNDPKHYIIADYECAMFVQGTGFWRAPEVLQELQKSEESRNGEIWIEKVDVYSFGMTCYEILTGQIPFAGYTKRKWDDVIRGERPSLPNYVFLDLRELVEACWHAQPSQRPSFRDIIDKLTFLRNEHIYFYLLRRFKSGWM